MVLAHVPNKRLCSNDGQLSELIQCAGLAAALSPRTSNKLAMLLSKCRQNRQLISALTLGFSSTSDDGTGDWLELRPSACNQ